MRPDELNKILEQHKLWLGDPSKGCRANLSEADLRGADLYRADLYRADLHGADLRGANLREAYLSGADLHGADLRGADLCGADLREAYLSGAYLSGANLYKANLRGAGVVMFQYNRNNGYYTGDNYITIGCERYTIDQWLEKYKELGQRNNYTEDEIRMYGKWIKMCKKLYKMRTK